ncbi:MAG: hypothetical protein A4E30_00244 [Methanomassiliicoccales archaeon PtaB.Bin215]|nr:MAG: hypothetical protein A4E30_00244 [Methanomassiliicoccales archaeon PtaB.Bin215]
MDLTPLVKSDADNENVLPFTDGSTDGAVLSILNVAFLTTSTSPFRPVA